MNKAIASKVSSNAFIMAIRTYFHCQPVATAPPAGTIVYETGKAAVIGLTRQMAIDFGPLGITVNAIAPGHMEASFITGVVLPVDGGLSIQLQENIVLELKNYIQEHPELRTFFDGGFGTGDRR